MGDENPIRTLGDYSKPSHEGYRNTIELPVGNNVIISLLNKILSLLELKWVEMGFSGRARTIAMQGGEMWRALEKVRLVWGDIEVTMQYLELKGGDRGVCKLLGDMVAMS
ncbi:hypothetical protein Tco_0881011 [Tanacetum coccineum]